MGSRRSGSCRMVRWRKGGGGNRASCTRCIICPSVFRIMPRYSIDRTMNRSTGLCNRALNSLGPIPTTRRRFLFGFRHARLRTLIFGIYRYEVFVRKYATGGAVITLLWKIHTSLVMLTWLWTKTGLVRSLNLQLVPAGDH